MAQAEDLNRIMASVAGREGPIFSAYLSVNAAVPENQGQAYMTRLRDAMNDEGVPEDVQKSVRSRVESETHPHARTLAVFAAPGEAGAVEVHRLQAEVPESFRWGDPHVAPLTLALDKNEPYGAVVLDAARFRYYVVSPLVDPEAGEEPKGNGFREVDVSPPSPGPRGGADQEDISRRTEANLAKFYNELGELARDVTFREGVRRLILAGPRERTAEFRDRLPNDLKDRVVAEERVDLGAPEGEILDHLEETRLRAEHERQKTLLDEIRESGVRGLEDTVKALQEENRVYHLAVLWELEGEVRWSDTDGLAILDITKEESPFSGDPTRVRPLADVLVDLAAARGARLDFMLGENENTDTLRDEFGGIAGLTRF